MHRIGYRVEKVWSVKKKFKNAHNLFVIKDIDLKIIFLKNHSKMDVEKCVTFKYLFKTKKKFCNFLTIFFAFFLPSIASKLLKL